MLSVLTVRACYVARWCLLFLVFIWFLPFLLLFLTPDCLCACTVYCFPNERRKLLNEVEQSLLHYRRVEVLNLVKCGVRPKLKEIILCTCFTWKASSIGNHWPQEDCLCRTINQAKHHNLYLLNNFYLYRLILCVLTMGLGKTSHYIFCSVIFKYFSSAAWSGMDDGDAVQMAQG